VNWTAFISKRSWPIQGTTTALSGNNWRKTRKPLRIWRIRAGMWTGTSRTHVQSPTDAPITLRQNASCAKSYWLCKLAWPGSESGPLSDFFLRDYDPKKKNKKNWFWWKKDVQILWVQLGVQSSLHVKVVTTRLCLVSILSVCGSRNTQCLHR